MKKIKTMIQIRVEKIEMDQFIAFIWMRWVLKFITLWLILLFITQNRPSIPNSNENFLPYSIELNIVMFFFLLLLFKYVFYRVLYGSVFDEHKITLVFCLQLNTRSSSMYFFASVFFSISLFIIFTWGFVLFAIL